MFDLQHTLDLMEEGAFDEAALTLRRAIAQMPAYAPAYVLLARAYEAQERWPEALAVWQRAHFFAPNSPVVEDGLLRMLDRHDAVAEEGAAATAFDVAPSDAIDQMADDLLEAIQEDTPDSPSARSESAAEETRETASQQQTRPEHEAESESKEAAASHTDEAPSPEEPSPEEPSPDESLSDEARDTASDEPRPGDAPARSDASPSPLEELAQRLPDTDQPLPADVQDLDRLIDELEGARIDPQPDLEDAPAPDLDNDIDDMVSETLARIYISQQQYQEAARVYTRLASQEPEQADEYLEKAADMRSRARDEEE